MSVGDVAGLIAAVAFVLLVGVLAIPLIKLGGVLDETRHMIKGVSDETVPLLNEVTTTVTTANAMAIEYFIVAPRTVLPAPRPGIRRVRAFRRSVRPPATCRRR